MCYSRRCRYENYWGECTLPHYTDCPFSEEETVEHDEEEVEEDDE